MSAIASNSVVADRMEGLLEARATHYEGLGLFYPCDAPGLAPPGPNFIRAALAEADLGEEQKLTKKLLELADTIPNLRTKVEKSRLKAGRAVLLPQLRGRISALYLKAIYQRHFGMAIQVRNQCETLPFIPGHIWGSGTALGPRSGVRARVVVVGKQPGYDEIQSRLNFHGRTSQMFIDVLNELEFDPMEYQSWYVTNLVRFFDVNSKTAPTATMKWARDCWPLLQYEIKVLRPEWVILLGAEPIKAWFGRKASADRLADQVLETTIDLRHYADEPVNQHNQHIVKVMTSIHPAILANDPSRRDDLNASLQFIRSRLHGEPMRVDFPDLHEHLVIETPGDLTALVDRLLTEGASEFAIDMEWEGRNPRAPGAFLATLQFSWDLGRAAVIHIRDADGRPVFNDDALLVRELTRLWDRDDLRIVGHNMNADLAWLCHLGLGFLVDRFCPPLDDPETVTISVWKSGAEKTRTQGGFDTMLAVHAINEVGHMGLKEAAYHYLRCPRYWNDLENWIDSYCAASKPQKVIDPASKKKKVIKKKIGRKNLPGYGHCPREILLPYALCDADYTFRLYRKFNEELLDRDPQFRLSSRMAFWSSMRGTIGFGEAMRVGMLVDVKRAQQLTAAFEHLRPELLKSLRDSLKWDKFNPDSIRHCREALFGESYCENIKRRPEGAITLSLRPYKTTGRRPKLWDQVTDDMINRGEAVPSTDKDVLIALESPNPALQMLRDYRFINQLLKIYRPPHVKVKEEVERVEIEEEVEDDVEFLDGLLSFLDEDDRIRTRFYQTLETGRSGSSGPAMQNVTFKRRIKDFRRIFKSVNQELPFPPQAIFRAPDGYKMVDVDYKGAELLMMAVQSGDRAMIRDCKRGMLPEDHPDHFDIHTSVAIDAFKIVGPDGLPPRASKSALAALEMEHLRDNAKTVAFGTAYGLQAEGAVRRAKAEGVTISIEDAELLQATLFSKYPCLEPYFNRCRRRSAEPGWLCDWHGRFRRFRATDDRTILSDNEREAGNFPIQGGVAEAVHLAIGNFFDYRRQLSDPLAFLMVLQIHDSLVFIVRDDFVETFVDTVVPKCMIEQVPIYPCELDGTLRPDPDAPYFLATDGSVMVYWGEKLKDWRPKNVNESCTKTALCAE